MDSACPHCGAPVALIDAEGVAKALHDLAASGAISPPASADSVRNALIDAQVNALFDLERMREREHNQDLLSVGAGAIGALVGGWLLSRS